ncbi:MAG: transcription-repair coupling factor [Eubacterium aggregans]|nr:transcription-repair coupling factor [Eubacterium aggregans]MDD4691019.1 transcription-repair coupling factor [Eubacterium aggregans]
MKHEYEKMIKAAQIQEAMTALDQEGIVNLSNVKTGLKGFLALAMWQSGSGNLLVVTATEREAARQEQVLRQFLGEVVVGYPVEPVHTYFSDAHSQEITQSQMTTIARLLSGKRSLVVTSADALLREMLPAATQAARFLTIRPGDTVDPMDLVGRLVDRGYVREDAVEARGQFALRGGIVDIYPITATSPCRMDFFDDEVESIRSFDPETQRSEGDLEMAVIAPARRTTLTPEEREGAWKTLAKVHGQDAGRTYLLADMKADLSSFDETLLAFMPERVTLLDYLGEGAILWDEPERAQETCDIFLGRAWADLEGLIEANEILPEEKNTFLTLDAFMAKAAGRPQLRASLFTDGTADGKVIDIGSKDLESFAGRIDVFVDYLSRRISEGFTLGICCKSEQTKKNVKAFLVEQGFEGELAGDNPGITLLTGELIEGFELPAAGLAFVNESELFKERRRTKRRHRLKGRKIDSFAQLKVGDYVVHDIHGIGIYRGVEQMTIDGLTKDLMVIEYQGDARFYLSIEQMDAVQAYIGTGGDRVPKLNKLGHPEWARAKSRARKAVEDMAEELIALYAKRRSIQGYAYSADTTWQQEFEDAFPYEETDDQLRSAEEIKGDMEKAIPMDRLLCGDVGYGKTEVALRAAFKAIMEGKQVAILVPTTILAQQHYNTIKKRFSHYPVAVDIISRFRTPKQQKATLLDVSEGKVDLIVGTHRLLSKDIKFKDLGLLIVDEEQRFGVRAKEKLKTLRENVDVLTLSATPIPRTLHMSMTGVRDMSVIEEPPQGRRPVQTYVMRYNPVILGDAMERELARGGQVYFVHNRVHDIMDVAGKVQQMVPDARIIVAHGQMSGPELEDVMLAFENKEYDILVTTTIVESGMDVSNANTMIVDNGDTFGLSQLYQLRGRVGRSDVQAYCYVTHHKQVLSEIAQKRLKAIKDFTAFGSGFKVAMRDLEIRGAGNLLGAEQSGHLFNIGYEMYCRILEETMESRLEGKESAKLENPLKINLDVDGYVPESYIDSEELKYEVYKKLSYIRSEREYSDLTEELLDRFGPVPQGVQNLMHIAIIKHLAKRLGMEEIRQRGTVIRFYFDEEREVPIPNPERIPLLFSRYGVKFKALPNKDNVWSITLRSEAGPEQLQEIINFLKEL